MLGKIQKLVKKPHKDLIFNGNNYKILKNY
jgi:hypothetical protein